jgi:hypothetical protein
MMTRFCITLVAVFSVFTSGLFAQANKTSTPSCSELLQSNSSIFHVDFRPYGYDSTIESMVHYQEASLINFVGLQSCFNSAIENSPSRDFLHHIHGKAIYRLMICEDGSVGKMCFVKLPHPLFDGVVRDCICKLEFVPASSSQGNVSSWVTFPFSIAGGG